MYPLLRLYEDVLANDGETSLPALPRMIFVVHGTVVIADRTLRDEDTFGGEVAVTLKAGGSGATVWRWELVAGGSAGGEAAGRGVVSRQKLAARLETVPQGALILRGDSVGVPAGRLRLSAPASGSGHPLPDRRRLSRRHRRPLDVIRPRRRVV